MFDDYFAPDKEHLLVELGQPLAVIAETPYEYFWARGSAHMGCTAEDYVCGWKSTGENVNKEPYICKIIGHTGEYYYLGVWQKHE